MPQRDRRNDARAKLEYLDERDVRRRTLPFVAMSNEAETTALPRGGDQFLRQSRLADPRLAAVKRVYANASIVGEDRVVFNIKGNTYRLVVAINYPYRMCYVRFIGPHQAYDRIDVATV